MQQVIEVVGRVDAQQPVDQQVDWIKRARLTLADDGITEASPIVPEGQFAVPQVLGVDDLLREVVAVNISADESAAGEQRPPEERRQSDRGHDDCGDPRS